MKAKIKTAKSTFTLPKREALIVLNKARADLIYVKGVLVTHTRKIDRMLREVERALKTTKGTKARKITFASK